MVESGVDSDFWWNLFAILAILVLLMTGFSAIMRKVFKVKREKFFSYNHINEKHKKVDWTIRITAIVCLTAGYAINSARDFADWFWFLQTWFILFLFVVISQLAKAVMERKYAENPNAFKVTISETVFIVLLLLSLYATDLWGLG